MKHAYLILAHNEFEILQRLLAALDDYRNDIYIHFDRKVKNIPDIKVNRSRLFVLEKRIDVCWGDVSVVEAEYLLFELAAAIGGYRYFHLLSGVDFPLKTQDYIHDFFNKHEGKEFIGFSTYDYHKELTRKVNCYHLFPRDFRPSDTIRSKFKKGFRALWLRIQEIFWYKRNRNIDFRKGTQWVSIGPAFLKYVIDRKSEVLGIYSHTFCSDEIFLQTLCWNSSFRDAIFDLSEESCGSQRDICWVEGQLVAWKNSDLDYLMRSNFLFARKFSGEYLDVVDGLYEQMKRGNE